MNTVLPDIIERGRLLSGRRGTARRAGVYGAFVVPGPCGADLSIVISDGQGWPFALPAWEHVAVSTTHRTPNWREMEWVREQCWSADSLVLQFSMPRQAHINQHPYCLHMWRPIGVEIPVPPPETVGVVTPASAECEATL